jgi:hypothetical protein
LAPFVDGILAVHYRYCERNVDISLTVVRRCRPSPKRIVGALGGSKCAAPGRRMSEYENAAGTGHIHDCFDVAA